MKRKYTLTKSRNQREIVIKRDKQKQFIVVENSIVLYRSSDFDLCVEFLELELNKSHYNTKHAQ